MIKFIADQFRSMPDWFISTVVLSNASVFSFGAGWMTRLIQWIFNLL